LGGWLREGEELERGGEKGRVFQVRDVFGGFPKRSDEAKIFDYVTKQSWLV